MLKTRKKYTYNYAACFVFCNTHTKVIIITGNYHGNYYCIEKFIVNYQCIKSHLKNKTKKRTTSTNHP